MQLHATSFWWCRGQWDKRWHADIALLLVKETQNLQHLLCGRSIPVTHREKNDSRLHRASSGIVLSTFVAGIDLPPWICVSWCTRQDDLMSVLSPECITTCCMGNQGSTFPTARRPGASKTTCRATKSYLVLARRGKCFSGKLKCCHMSDNRCTVCTSIEVQRNDVSQSKLQLYSTRQLFICAY